MPSSSARAASTPAPRRGARALPGVALAAWTIGLLVPAAAGAQPYARFAVADSALPAAVKASGGQFESAWNALLVSELRASLARADSAARLLALARRVAGAETAALGSHIAPDAMKLRERWTPEQRRLRVSAAVSESLGVAARTARNFDRADSLLGSALRSYERLGETRRVAVVWGTLAATAFDRTDWGRADSLYRQALAARRAIGDQRMIGNALNGLGSTHYYMRRYDEAWRYYQEARAVREQTGERSALAATFNGLGNVAADQGRPDTAAVCFLAAIDLAVALGDSARTYEVVQNYAWLLAGGSTPGAAVPHFERALAIAVERGNPAEQAPPLTGMGSVLRQQGHFTEAAARLEESCNAAMSAGNPELLRGSLLNLGQVRMNLGDIAGARPPLERSLVIADSLDNPVAAGQALNNLSNIADEEGDRSGAERLARRALSAAVTGGDSVLVHEVTNSLGHYATQRGDLAGAQAWFQRSLSAATRENLRLEATYNLAATAALANRHDEAEGRFKEVLDLARKADAPEFQWTALLGLGDVAERRGADSLALVYDRQAAEMIENLRAGQGTERPSVALLSERLWAFEALIHLLGRLHSRDPKQQYAAEAFHWSERARARAFLDLVAASAGPASSPPKPLTLAEAQGLLKSDKEALLAYSVGDSSTSFWVVTRKTWRYGMLPARKALRPRIEMLRRGLADPATADSKSTHAAARALYQTLIEPALPMLDGVDHLIIAPDGALATVPFEALLSADADADGPPPRGAYLVERFAVSYTPSASALATRTGAAGGAGIVAFGDPRFATDSGAGTPALPALPNTAAEIAALRSVAGTRPMRAITGANATREMLLTMSDLPAAALIHIATHGTANEVEPERSGLWMAAAPGAAGPGFVSVSDIMSLKLSAGLVTLSACETGLGRLERGEGVIGLTRAFLAAGAQSVTVSLWKVNDRSTAMLMDGFYRDLLKQNQTAATALARAKRELLRNPETRSPFYWAPFVLMGSAGKLRG